MEHKAQKNGRRTIKCSFCGFDFTTKGTTRVLRKICFQFCASCWWHKRDACEAFAVKVAA